MKKILVLITYIFLSGGSGSAADKPLNILLITADDLGYEAMNPSERNVLCNKEGILALPFRTDDWPLFDPEAELITVNKPKDYEPADWERPKMAQ